MNGDGHLLPLGGGVVGASIGVFVIAVEACDLEDAYVNVINVFQMGKALDEFFCTDFGILSGFVDEGELQVAQILEVV